MIYGPYSTVGATSAELSLRYYLDSEAYYDFLYCLASTDGTNFNFLTDAKSVSLGSSTLARSLPAALLGQPTVYLGFRFESDGSNTAGGAFIDDIT